MLNNLRWVRVLKNLRRSQRLNRTARMHDNRSRPRIEPSSELLDELTLIVVG